MPEKPSPIVVIVAAQNVTGTCLDRIGNASFTPGTDIYFLRSKDEDQTYMALCDASGSFAIYEEDNPAASFPLGGNETELTLPDDILPEFRKSPCFHGHLSIFEQKDVAYRCDMTITNEESFLELVGAARVSDLKDYHLINLFELPVSKKDAGLSKLSVKDLEISLVEGKAPKISVTVSAVVTDFQKFMHQTRRAYANCWGDQNFRPRSFNEALYELSLASNGNDSPDVEGFQIDDWQIVERGEEPLSHDMEP